MTFRNIFPALFCLILLALQGISCNSSGSSVTEENSTGIDARTSDQRILDKKVFAAAIKKSGAVVVDVRMPQEYEQGHINKAININFFDPEFKYKLLELNKNKKYYLYCKNETRSYRAMEFMKDNDFSEVYMLKGGYENWSSDEVK
jgi:rhodanese-related sulfurtransferase